MKVDIPRLVLPLVEKYKDKTGKRLFNFYQYYADEKGFNKAINYGLKEIGTILEIDDLEYYAARHSWATIANYRNYQQELISNAMGHSSVKVTETYFRRHSDDKIWDMNKEILSYIFDKQ